MSVCIQEVSNSLKAQQEPNLWQVLTGNSLRVGIAAAADRHNLEIEKIANESVTFFFF